jgi:hypothetical protein
VWVVFGGDEELTGPPPKKSTRPGRVLRLSGRHSHSQIEDGPRLARDAEVGHAHSGASCDLRGPMRSTTVYRSNGVGYCDDGLAERGSVVAPTRLYFRDPHDTFALTQGWRRDISALTCVLLRAAPHPHANRGARR